MTVAAGAKVRALKASFWTILLIMVFSGIVITADMFGYAVPIPRLTASHVNTYRFYRENGTMNTRALSENNELTTKRLASTPKPVHKSQKATHIGFLKVHKAGSTTMQNMFFRFGLKHNLNVLIPKQGNYLFSKGAALRPNNKDFSHYDVFACHTVYSKSLYSQLLPDDQIKIGIIREPLDRMISGAYYYRDVWGVGYLKSVPAANFIHNLVNYPEKYDKQFFSRTRNSMGKDFGFPSNVRPEDKTILKQKLDMLDNEFALVMVTERFDESLVLMKRLLHWSFADIIYLLANTHKHTPTVLSEEEVNKFKTTSFLDYAIYDYFTKEFERKVKEAGVDLQEEVKFFQKCLVKVKDFCGEVNVTSKTLEFPESKWDDSFTVIKADCLWMKTQELKFIDQLRGLYKGTKHVIYSEGPVGKKG